MVLGACLSIPDDSENPEGESFGKARGRRVQHLFQKELRNCAKVGLQTNFCKAQLLGRSNRCGTWRSRNAAGGRHTGFAAGEEYLDRLLDLEFIVSACLSGCRCRYDNDHSEDKYIRELVENGQALPVCPEMAAGLTVPRPAAEIIGGDGNDVLAGCSRVVTQNGDDVTDVFITGARATAAIAKSANIKKAILKSGSPSCGVTEIGDGTFSGTKKAGIGVTAALLRREGISLMSM